MKKLLFLFLFCAVSSYAVSIPATTFTVGGWTINATTQVTKQALPATGIDYSVTMTVSGNSAFAVGIVYIYNSLVGGTSPDQKLIQTMNKATGLTTFTNTFTGSFGGSAVKRYYFMNVSINGQPGSQNSVVVWIDQTYAIDVPIPANPSDSSGDPASPRLQYTFYQDGATINVLNVYGGSAAQTLHLTGLASNSPVTYDVVRQKAVFVTDPISHVSILVDVPTTLRSGVVAGAPDVVAPTASVAPSATNSSIRQQIGLISAPTPTANVTPQTAVTPVSAPTASTQIGIPSPYGKNFSVGDQSLTTAATSGDIAKSANSIVDALSGQSTAATDAGNKVIDSLDKINTYNGQLAATQVTATGKVASAVTDGANGIIASNNNIVTNLVNGTNQITQAVNLVGGILADNASQGSAVAGAAQSGIGQGSSDELAGKSPFASSNSAAFGDMSNATLNDIPYVDSSTEILPPVEALGHTFNLKPFAFFPLLSTYAAWIREIFNFGFGLSFVIFGMKTVERYYIAWWNTPQAQTKDEPAQMLIPGVGWGKQVSTALTLSSVLIAAVGVLIATINSHVPDMVSGMTIVNAVTKGKSVIDPIIVSLGMGAKIVNTFFPIASLFSFLGASLVVQWSAGVIFGGALWVAKNFNI